MTIFMCEIYCFGKRIEFIILRVFWSRVFQISITLKIMATAKNYVTINVIFFLYIE